MAINNATESVEITSKGIRIVLNKYTPQRAIAEYIWNGFDAHANEVRVYTESETVYDSITCVKGKGDKEGTRDRHLSQSSFSASCVKLPKACPLLQ